MLTRMRCGGFIGHALLKDDVDSLTGRARLADDHVRTSQGSERFFDALFKSALYVGTEMVATCRSGYNVKRGNGHGGR
jgi:hypothetical protein